jgi:integrase
MMQFSGRPNTIRAKTSLFNNWIDKQLKHDGSNLDACVKLWEEHLEPHSVRQVMYVAKEVVKRATGVELDIRPHVSRVMRSKQQKEVNALSKEEIVALSATCKASDKKLYFPLMLSLHTGMRRGEVWGLTWDDVDVLNNKIHVSKSYNGPTKNGKSRIVPISAELEKIILAHQPTKSYNCLEAVIKSFDPNPRLRRIAKKAGVRENITFHTLRHTFATLALEAGRSPALVSRTLGHSNISTTLDIYWSAGKEEIDLGFLSD